MSNLRLYKKDKLCCVTAIDRLFAAGSRSALVYPLRMVWTINMHRRCDAPVQFLISVPKKRLRHAVDRVLIRRRTREAFRINRHTYPLADGIRADVAFIYVGKTVEPYALIARAMQRLLAKLAAEKAVIPEAAGAPAKPTDTTVDIPATPAGAPADLSALTSSTKTD